MEKSKTKEIALERVKILFKEAQNIFNEDPELSNNYIQKARKIAMKVNLKIPTELKRRFCKHCYSFLMPGKNCRIRTKNVKVIYYCINCKKYTRYPFIKEKKG